MIIDTDSDHARRDEGDMCTMSYNICANERRVDVGVCVGFGLTATAAAAAMRKHFDSIP